MSERKSIEALFGNPTTNATSPKKNNPYLPIPSPQQEEILNVQLKIGESLQVEAGAGGGKTTTTMMFANSRSNQEKLLYVCFTNKGAQEAKEKFTKAGLTNTRVSTIHGLAFLVKRRFEEAKKFQTKISVRDLRAHNPEITHYIQGWNVQETIKKFCESEKTEITEDHVPELSRLTTVEIEKVVKLSRLAWERMRDVKHKAPLSYDHYLKIYDLENHALNYDYILLDEAQDSNPVTYNIIRKQAQRSRIILIGDSRQAIYKWRGAKDAMREWKSDLKKPLNESFRFGPNIAAAASVVLKTFYGEKEIIRGKKPSDELAPIKADEKYTMVARTNASLFDTALTMIDRNRKYHFVGTEASRNWDPSIPYRFSDALDVMNLRKGDRSAIKNLHIAGYENYAELKLAAEGITGPNGVKRGGDYELESLCKIVEKHGDQLPNLIKKIVENCCGPNEADIQLVTTHRAKGLEWDNVVMANDFAQLIIKDEETGVERLAIAGDASPDSKTTCDIDLEEVNLIYVAVTRAKNKLQISERCVEFFLRNELLPNHVAASPELELVEAELLKNPTPITTTPNKGGFSKPKPKQQEFGDDWGMDY